jgi:uncharacterized protein YuzB (UPF0349 family)
MQVTTKFCPCNFTDELHEVKAKLKELSNVNVVENKCLNYCGQCLEHPFSLVNGKNIVSDTSDELYEHIKNHLEVISNTCTVPCTTCNKCS